jgi:hypothetical protein
MDERYVLTELSGNHLKQGNFQEATLKHRKQALTNGSTKLIKIRQILKLIKAL